MNATPLVEGNVLSIVGEVVRGDGRGRQIGFPTANLRVIEGDSALAALEFGVYAASVLIDGQARQWAVANWGRRPTFGSDAQAILELHIIEFCEDIYGRRLRVELKNFLRPEKAFVSPEKLKEQIADDVQRTRQLITEIREE